MESTLLYMKGMLAILGVKLFALLMFLILSAVVIIVVVMIQNKTNISLGLGPFKIRFGTNKDNNFDGMITDLIEYYKNHTKRILENRETLIKRQLSYAEKKLAEIKYHLSNAYLKKLSSKLEDGADAKLHKDFRHYQVILGIMNRELLEKVFEDAFIENHLEDVDDIAWKNYIDDKYKFVVNYITDFQDTVHTEGKVVSRDESYNCEKEIYPQIKEIVREIFDNAREISVIVKNDLNVSENRVKMDLEEICGKNGYKQPKA